MDDQPIIKLTPMRYEVATRDSRHRPTYTWRNGFLAKGVTGSDLYPPTSWVEACEETRRHHPNAKIVKGA